MSEHHPSPERPYPLDHEGRIARLEGIVEQIDVRLGRVEAKIDATREALEAKIDANRQAINDTRKDFLRWVVALHVATWGLIGALKLFG
ncbi:MAG: hypothetical protein OXE49_05340 [Gemmatimonadetes bacterium]|nr:hypothetical protein [Gemmatimonadota bacterium]